MPVYLFTERAELIRIWPLIVLAAVGVVIGTVAGARLLKRVPEPAFRRIVAVLLLALGAWMILRGRA
jgi:uncharacterized membrane protein YfcA